MTIERIGDKVKPCTYCAQYGHTAWKCQRKPRATLVTTKPMRKIGKVGKKWIETRHDWIQKNASAAGWKCYICQTSLTLETLTLDHIKSRSRHPELRYEHGNLAPCCAKCNADKGSRDITEI